MKRSKDEIKQRTKKLKTTNKPKYISEYINQSQNVPIESSSNIMSPTDSALVLMNMNKQSEISKKERLKNEKLKIEREKYFKEQLWEEHCYTPDLPWLASNKQKGKLYV